MLRFSLARIFPCSDFSLPSDFPFLGSSLAWIFPCLDFPLLGFSLARIADAAALANLSISTEREYPRENVFVRSVTYKHSLKKIKLNFIQSMSILLHFSPKKVKTKVLKNTVLSNGNSDIYWWGVLLLGEMRSLNLLRLLYKRQACLPTKPCVRSKKHVLKKSGKFKHFFSQRKLIHI